MSIFLVMYDFLFLLIRAQIVKSVLCSVSQRKKKIMGTRLYILNFIFDFPNLRVFIWEKKLCNANEFKNLYIFEYHT